VRVFAGLPLPAGAKKHIVEYINSWCFNYSGLKPVKENSLHITLHFFGEKDPSEVKAISEAMENLKGNTAVPASLGGISSFPPRGTPRVFYLELIQGREEVKNIYTLFLKLLAPLGYKEERNFIPHITLARNRIRKKYTLPEPVNIKGFQFSIDRIILFESRLKPDGAEYFPLKTIMLI
jgi:2'-5' RNA ligase